MSFGYLFLDERGCWKELLHIMMPEKLVEPLLVLIGLFPGTEVYAFDQRQGHAGKACRETIFCFTFWVGSGVNRILKQ